MPESKILLDQAKRLPTIGESPERAWRAVARFGLLLALIALSDIVLAFYPLRFGRPEWEFATVAASFAGLPLVTLGMAAVLGSALARGLRRSVLWTAVALLVLGVLVLGLLLLFLTDVPVALRSVQGEVRVGVMKAILRTAILGLGFGGTYVVTGAAALLYVQSAGRRPME